METDNKPLKPEWSHRVTVDQISHRPLNLSFSAGPQERKDLARRLRVQSIEDATATVSVVRESGTSIIHVEGTVKGNLTQSCIVTGQPVTESINEEFESWYADPAQAVPFVKARREKLVRGEREMEILPERDDPELVTDGFIDVAELATQYLSLGINPYPRASDEPPLGVEDNVQVIAPARKSPFAALKDWKNRQGGGQGSGEGA